MPDSDASTGEPEIGDLGEPNVTSRGSIRALVVDDSEFFAEMTADTLASEHDIDAHHDTSGEDALETLEDDNFDCIVSDYAMPGMDGLEFLEAVRAEFAELPFILVTGRGDEEVASKAIASGVADYLLKLEVVEDQQYGRLANRIKSVVSKHRTATKYGRLVESVPDVVAHVDDSGTILGANPAMAEVLGTAREELVGSSVTDVFPGEVGEGRLELGREAIETDQTLSVRDEHDARHYQTALVPVGQAAGASTFHVIARDITELKRREKQLKRQNEQLEDFASVISHDLRNPLNVAQSSLELLEAEGVDSDHTDRLDRSLGRMADIIDDVLTLAREGAEVRETSVVDLETMAREAWSVVDAENVTLVVDESRRFRADSGRLKQLLENLLGNAVTHGHPADESGGLRIEVGLLDDGFYVADDGPGIPEPERETVFEVGYSTTTDGTGLGLSIVEEIADAHGWTVRFTESEYGGARFEIGSVEGP